MCIFPVGSGGGGGDVDDGDGDLAAGDGVDGGGGGGGGGGSDGDGDGGDGDDDGDDAGDDGDDDGAGGVSLFGASLGSVSMMETEVRMVGLASGASWLAQVGSTPVPVGPGLSTGVCFGERCRSPLQVQAL